MAAIIGIGVGLGVFAGWWVWVDSLDDERGVWRTYSAPLLVAAVLIVISLMA